MRAAMEVRRRPRIPSWKDKQVSLALPSLTPGTSATSTRLAPEHRAEPIQPGALEQEAAAGVLQHVGEFAAGIGAAHRDRAVVTRDTAAVDDAIQFRETVV